MNQFEEISAFRCKQCGATLKTEAGLRRHETHCKLNPRIDRNQMSIFDYLTGGVRRMQKPEKPKPKPCKHCLREPQIVKRKLVRVAV